MDLTADGICKIIEACKQSKVSRIVFDGARFEVDFALSPIAETTPHAETPNLAEPKDEITTPVKMTEVSITPSIDNVTQDLEELQLSDPALFEEMVARGELVSGAKEAHE